MYKLIDRLSPDYEKLMSFMKIALSLNRNAPKIAVWDIARLKRYHGESSQYLHFQGIPNDTFEVPTWLGQGIAKLEEMASYIWNMMTSGCLTGNMAPTDMEPETQVVWQQFKDGKIDDVSVITQLQIAQPALRARRLSRKRRGT